MSEDANNRLSGLVFAALCGMLVIFTAPLIDKARANAGFSFWLNFSKM